MNQSYRTTLAVLSIVTGWMATQTTARADLTVSVVPTVTMDPADSTYTYSYTVTNDSASTVGIEEFDLAASADANLVSITNPAGFFAFYTTGFEDIEFNSFDASTDIAPGASGTFAFTSDDAPVLGAFAADGIDSTTGDFFQFQGTALTPTGVPEPSTFALCGVGLAATAFARRRRRRQA